MTRMILHAMLAAVLWPLPAAGEDNPAPQRIYEVAKARPLPAGAPQASDVIMRSLTLRKGSDADQHDTFRALTDFHVNRLEWAYIRDQDFIRRCQDKGVLFGGAASSAMSHVVMPKDESDFAALACVDLAGKPVVPTWKRTWRPPGNWWMCVNNPTLETCYVEYLKSCVDAGSQVMQRDEPWGNYRAVDWGGCFCNHCLDAFRKCLAETATAEQLAAMGIQDIRSFNYRQQLLDQNAPVGDDFKRFDGGELKQRFVDFQQQSTIEFHQRTRKAVNEHAGRRVAFSCNNGCQRWTPIEMLFDWCFGELPFSKANPSFIHHSMLQAASLERRQVITMPKKSDHDDPDGWCRLTRQTIAMAYACGGHCMVPWDVYMPGDAPRYFGTSKQYGDLFGFIRANSAYLDAYEYAGAVGAGFVCDLYGDLPPIEIHGSDDICAVIRAVPGQANAPVVVHLIDWSDRPQPFHLSLDPTAFFGRRPLRIRRLRPAAYDRTQHERAENSRSYGELVETQIVPGGYTTSLTLPAANPWLILVIEPDDTIIGGVWQRRKPGDPLLEWQQELRRRYGRDRCLRPPAHTAGTNWHRSLPGRQISHPIREALETFARRLVASYIQPLFASVT